ncbi:MAG: endonuclease domain-containing protein [Melioribacteraceae bacterium]|nr:endonuclease domain-containing protein [Melioribacteraceae bacterium]MCF8263040.1 endonuclease domain-containing protein [Melioribacteraceae bacterium]MCF8430485.1 endonuclease domain-containing protein [Melioribacteraceae bacterium]
MTQHFNRTEMKETRRKLRRNQTIAEKNMWSQLRNRQFLGLKFRRQYSIDRYVIDFYCPEFKIAIELDGSIHDLDDVKEYDTRRQKHIEAFGVTFIRVTNDEYLGNPNKTFERVEREINQLLLQD